MRHQNNFDLIRILAAFQVALGHASSHLEAKWLLPIAELSGYLPGVPIFFIISGVLVSASYERSTVKHYAINRALRIFPGLWGCLAVSIAIAMLCGVSFANKITAPWLAAQLTFAQFFNPDFLRGFGVGVLNGSLWTISVELQFYLALPLIFWLLSKGNKNLIVAALFAVSVVASLVFERFYDHDSLALKLVSVSILPYLYMFLIGIALHVNFERLKKLVAGRALLWGIAFIVADVLLGALGMEIRGNLPNAIVCALLGLVILSIAYTRTGAHQILRGNDLSYGLYIYHMPVINVLVFLGLFGSAYAALALFCAISLAWASWKLIERPALRLKVYGR